MLSEIHPYPLYIYHREKELSILNIRERYYKALQRLPSIPTLELIMGTFKTASEYILSDIMISLIGELALWPQRPLI